MTAFSTQLREALKLQNNPSCFKRIRMAILQVGKKHLDLTMSGSVQVKANKAIKEELADAYNDFFGQDDADSAWAFKCALKYIHQQHSTFRSKHNFSSKTLRGSKHPILGSKNKKLKRLKSVADPPAIGESVDVPLSPADTPLSLTERMKLNLELYSSNLPTSFQSQSVRNSVDGDFVPSSAADMPLSLTERMKRNLEHYSSNYPTPSQSRSVTMMVSDIPKTARPSTQQTRSVFIPAKSRSNSRNPFNKQMLQSAQHSVSCSSLDDVNFHAIEHFLQSCIPPMGHFIHRFINAGLRTEEGLLGASKWRQELVQSFIDQLPPHPNGSPVLPMEKLVLLHQFQTYFL